VLGPVLVSVGGLTTAKWANIHHGHKLICTR